MPTRGAAGLEAGAAVDRSAPEQWWKEDAEQTLTDPESGGHGRAVSPRGEIIQSTQILSMVGNQPILAGDLLARINELLKPLEGRVPEDDLDQQRWLLMERLLPAAIEAKLVYLDFTRGLEKAQLELIQKNVFEQFDEKQLPEMVKRAGVRSAAELDAKMRSFGSSLDSVRRGFFEQVAAREMIRKHGEDDSEVTHDQLLAYYQDHLADYEVKAKARWEHMMVRFDRFKSEQEAHAALGHMGNAVLRGTPFAVVARRDSQGPRAEYGGQYDWTFQGSLASEVLDDAIFSLPVGVLSDRLKDETGWHIVRVIERKEAGRVPFLEAQVDIREKIKEQRRDTKIKAYLDRLKRETYVSSVFE
jgi:parvulin-like peptidyl-prolyl isomerase